jgi:2Fe-2S ferredoxin
MSTINFILKDGSTHTIDAKDGVSVMENAIFGNIRGIEAECGGSCVCATCHVYVADEFLARIPAPDEMEDEMLDGVAAERRPNSRLSCQITMSAELDGLTVQVPERQS